ncbi:hypothetical protein C8Q77DRAFT_210881 [Trametes polyzona]|nr:hypothetical protein C8Q77DRAFT_210881 [Trametes polyzona]
MASLSGPSLYHDSNRRDGAHLARPPFDNAAADTILRSSDDVVFHVHSVILAEASEVFAGMFTVPQPTDTAESLDYADGKPIVRLEEDSRTLDDLLRFCYPISDPPLRGPLDLHRVLKPALKYEINVVIEIMKHALETGVFMWPLETWAVACSLGLEEEAERAARALCLNGRTTVPCNLEYPAVLSEITAGQYLRLLKFVEKGGEVASGFSFVHPNQDDIAEEEDLLALRNPPTYTILTLQDRPFADIICRSSDGVELLSHKAILATVSPILRDMVVALESCNGAAVHPATPDTLPRTSGTTEFDSTSSLPVLEFTEPATTLSPLLELCYPVPRSPLHDRFLSLPVICAATRAAEAYAMPFVLRILEGAFRATEYHGDSLLAAFLLAAHAGLDTYAREAERRIIRDKRPLVSYGWCREMEDVPAVAFHELMMKQRSVEQFGVGYYEKFLGHPRKRRRIEEAE